MESCELSEFKNEYIGIGLLPDSIRKTRAVIIIEEIPLN